MVLHSGHVKGGWGVTSAVVLRFASHNGSGAGRGNGAVCNRAVSSFRGSADASSGACEYNIT